MAVFTIVFAPAFSPVLAEVLALDPAAFFAGLATLSVAFLPGFLMAFSATAFDSGFALALDFPPAFFFASDLAFFLSFFLRGLGDSSVPRQSAEPHQHGNSAFSDFV